MRLHVTLTDDEGVVRLPRSLAAASGLRGEVEFAAADGQLTLRRPEPPGHPERCGDAAPEDDRCPWD